MRTLPVVLALLGACRTPSADCTVDGATGSQAQAWFPDADEDGFGDPGAWVLACETPAGFVDNAEDCDDEDGAAFPGATETCDGADNDCDREVDEGALLEFWLDRDGDGYGAGVAWSSCVAPQGYTSEGGDCDDADDAVRPGVEEVCDGRDTDCDPATSETVTRTCHPDGDGDGYGDGSVALPSCDAACPSGQVEDTTDCDDDEAATRPGADEVCDGKDNDCDAATFPDEGAECFTGSEPVYDASSGHVYLTVTFDDSWSGANNLCGDRGYHLAWIDSSTEATLIEDLAADDGNTGPLWIGVRSSACGVAGPFRRVDARATPDACSPVSAWESSALASAGSSGVVRLEDGALSAVSESGNFHWYVCEAEP